MKISKHKITQAEITRMVKDRPAVYEIEYQHDTWCMTLKTGRGLDCNCTPDMYLITRKP